MNSEEPPKNVYTSTNLVGHKTLWALSCTFQDIANEIQPDVPTVVIVNFQEKTLRKLPDTVFTLTIRESPSLESIEAFPAQLESLVFGKMPRTLLESLPAYPTSLTSLTMESCELTEVPPYPASVSVLHLTKNNITKLPTSWSGDIRVLNVSFNKIESFESYPTNLDKGDFGYNKLREIPPITIATSPTLDFDGNPLIQPFKSIFSSYDNQKRSYWWLLDLATRNAMDSAFKQRIGNAWRQIYRSRGRNLATVQALVGARKNNTITRTTNTGETQNLPNIASQIASFLTGKKGYVSKQMAALKQTHNATQGGKRKTRRGKKLNHKRRSKSYKRTQ